MSFSYARRIRDGGGNPAGGVTVAYTCMWLTCRPCDDHEKVGRKCYKIKPVIIKNFVHIFLVTPTPAKHTESGMYGHEQRHAQLFIKAFQDAEGEVTKEVDKFLNKCDYTSLEDCERKKTKRRKEILKAIAPKLDAVMGHFGDKAHAPKGEDKRPIGGTDQSPLGGTMGNATQPMGESHPRCYNWMRNTYKNEYEISGDGTERRTK